MPPRMSGVFLYVRLIRLPYTTAAWFGRWPASPPGEYASLRRRFFATV